MKEHVNPLDAIEAVHAMGGSGRMRDIAQHLEASEDATAEALAAARLLGFVERSEVGALWCDDVYTLKWQPRGTDDAG